MPAQERGPEDQAADRHRRPAVRERQPHRIAAYELSPGIRDVHPTALDSIDADIALLVGVGPL